MKKISLEEFTERIINLKDEESFEMNCKDSDGRVMKIWFEKRMYKAFGTGAYFYIVYSYPFTRDAGFIQEDSETGWEENIEEVWNDITGCCGLIPFEE